MELLFFSEVYTAGKKLGTFSPVFKFKVSISHMKNKFSLLKCFFFYSNLQTEKNQEFMKIILFVSTGASEDIFFLSGQFPQFDLDSFLSCV